MSQYPKHEREALGFNHYDVNTIWKRILPWNGKDVNIWERITNEDDVQKMTLAWQRKHFTQASETPLATVEWSDLLRDEKTQQNILDGDFDIPEELQEEVKEVFQQLRKNNSISEEIKFQSSLKEFERFVRYANESTSTSPSGRSYSHYKSLLHNEESKNVLEIIHGILELAREHEVVLDRWKTTVTTLIEKDPGDPKIHRMRAIQIIEAEVQFIAKLFYAKKALANGEKHKQITPEQYGGRSRKQAQSAVLNKVLYHAITRQTKVPAAFMDDDARNCYDRILAALSAVEMRAWGQSYKESEFSINFLENQQYHVRTGVGTSKNYYTYSREDPTHGSGQGIGWAGAKFTKSSDLVARILSKTCPGMHFTNPRGTIRVDKNGDWFVDDTALGVTSNIMKEVSILKQLEHDQQKHAYVLFAMGHKLALDKCSFYLVEFIRDKLEYRIKYIQELPGELKLREGYDMELKTIKRLQPFTAHRTLGMWVAVDGNNRKQLEVLHKKIDAWCDKIRTRYLSSENTIKAYQGYLEPGLRYALSMTSYTYDECEKMCKKFAPILLNAIGIQRNCARSVLYAPQRYGGYGIRHLYHVQGLEKISFMFMHYRKKDTTGKLIQISMDWTDLELGMGRSFMSLSAKKWHHLATNTWLTHLWQYVEDCGMKLKFTKQANRELPRKNDFYLMDIINQKEISIQDQKIFNEIRIHMKLLSASDIVQCNSDYQILPSIYDGKNVRESTLKWPLTQEFPKEWLKTWKSLLMSYILPRLRHAPLGQWYKPSHQKWPIQTTANKTFLEKNGILFKLHDTHTSKYLPTAQNPPAALYPADVDQTNPDSPVFVYGVKKTNKTMTKKDTRDQPIPQWMFRNWGDVNMTASKMEEIAEQIQDNNIIAASDGTVQDGKAAHAWCIAEKNGNVLCESSAPVDGDPTTMTSFRAEACGALAVISMINHICNLKQLKRNANNTIEIYVDNKETLQVMRQIEHTTTSVKQDHIDVAIQLHTASKESPMKIIGKYVKAHMDEEVEDEDELTIEQRLNVRMDRLAGIYLKSTSSKPPPSNNATVFPAQSVYLENQGYPQVTQIGEQLIFGKMHQKIVQHVHTYHGIHPDHFKKVDFNTMKKTLSRETKLKGKRLKAINGQWATMERQANWNQTDSPKCPLCHRCPETWMHVLRCPQMDMERVRTEKIAKLCTTMRSLKTMPEMETLLKLIVTKWMDGKEVLFDEIPTVNDFKLHQLYDDQNAIGINAMFKGFMSKKWGDMQHNYYRTIKAGRKYNVSRWKNKIQTFFADFLHTMWVERCSILHAESMCTEENTFRNQMRALHEQTQSSEIHRFDRHLLKKRHEFFRCAPRANIEMWFRRLSTSILREKRGKITKKIRLQDM